MFPQSRSTDPAEVLIGLYPPSEYRHRQYPRSELAGTTETVGVIDATGTEEVAPGRDRRSEGVLLAKGRTIDSSAIYITGDSNGRRTESCAR